MTLLEALLATVILAVVAVACLEGTHGAAALQRRTASMSDALSRAETAMETAATGSVLPATGSDDVTRPSVQRTPYGAGTGLQRVEVSVRDGNGRVVRLTRLVDASAGGAPGVRGGPSQ